MGRVSLIIFALAMLPLASVAQPGPPAKKPADKVPGFREDAEVGVFKFRVEAAGTRILALDRLSKFGVKYISGGYVIDVRMENTSKDLKRDYKTWRAFEGQVISERAVLRDAAGNTYKPLPIPDDFAPENSPVNDYSFYPLGSVTEQLYFEKPIDGYKSLTLTLPLKNIGEVGELAFVLASEAVNRPNLVAATPATAVVVPAPKPKPKLELIATHTVSGTARKPVVAGKSARHVEDYERLEFGNAPESAAAAKLLADGSVVLLTEPTPVALDGPAFKGWRYCRPTEGPHKGKLLAVREGSVGAAAK